MIESSALPSDVASIESAIDTRANAKGTWQWVILVGHDARATVGIHTWKEGYLSETYRQLIHHFEAEGYLVGSFKKEKDKLMKFLTQVARLKGVTFSEFTP